MRLTFTITLEVGREDQANEREVSVDATLERRDDDDDVVPRSRRAGF